MFAVCLIKDYHGQILLVETKEEADAKVVDHVNLVTGENFRSFDEYYNQDKISLDSCECSHPGQMTLEIVDYDVSDDSFNAIIVGDEQRDIANHWVEKPDSITTEIFKSA